MKKIRFCLALLPVLFAPKVARADSCVRVRLESRSMQSGDQVTYEIDFVNRCGVERSLYWCAENPAAPVPPQIACPSPLASPTTPVTHWYALAARRRFQWTLPKGTRIRFRDCPAGERPTFGFTCAPAF